MVFARLQCTIHPGKARRFEGCHRHRTQSDDALGTLVQLFEETIRRHIEPAAKVTGYESVPTPERERVYGTAAVQRYAVQYDGHSGRRATVTLFVKDAPLVERRVLELFSRWAQAGVPYSHALDLTTDGPVPVCQQDLAPDEGPPGEAMIRSTADRLARIHLANAGHADGLAWLPRADRAYFEGGFVLGNCWEQWDETMRIERFAREWGHKRSWLEAAAQRFLADMDRLWAEGDSLTLVHADLHRDHILLHDGEPYVIDWGQARAPSISTCRTTPHLSRRSTTGRLWRSTAASSPTTDSGSGTTWRVGTWRSSTWDTRCGRTAVAARRWSTADGICSRRRWRG